MMVIGRPCCGGTGCPRLLLISYYGTSGSLSVSTFVCCQHLDVKVVVNNVIMQSFGIHQDSINFGCRCEAKVCLMLSLKISKLTISFGD